MLLVASKNLTNACKSNTSVTPPINTPFPALTRGRGTRNHTIAHKTSTVITNN